MSTPSNLDIFYLSNQKVTQLNNFLTTKHERIKFIPFSTYIQKTYHPPKHKFDSFPALYSTYVKLHMIYNKISSYPKISKYLIPSTKHPCLLIFAEKINSLHYSSLYEFGCDLRIFWNYYFRYYSRHPKEYRDIYYMSEFCEEVFKEIENSCVSYYNEDMMFSVEEKEKLVNDITKLDTKYLKGIIQMLSGNVSEDNIENEERVYEFDIEKLSRKELKKLSLFVKEKMAIQEMENKKENEKVKRKEDLEMKRISQLKKDLGFA